MKDSRQAPGAQGDLSILGRRYGWSNADGMNMQTLCLKVLRAGRYEDMLRLARHTGTDFLQEMAVAKPELRSNRFLMRKLENLRLGFGEHGR